MSVSTTHPSYDDAYKKALLSKQASRGLDDVTGKAYISKRSGEDADKHKARVEKAIYTNYTGRTRKGLSGAVFRIEPSIKLPSIVDYLETDVDGMGQSVTQLSKQVIDEMLEQGGICLLADYPQADGPLTLEQQRALNLRPSIAVYPRSSLLNWKTSVIGGVVRLSLVVLKEAKAVGDDEFGHESEDQFRVLRLRENVYTQQIYDKDQNAVSDEIIVRHSGGTFDHIPFYTPGTMDNLPDWDEPALYDIAKINIGHYRNSADHESNLSVHSGATLVLATSQTEDQWKTANPNGVTVGENAGIRVSADGSAHLLQIESAQAIKEEMEHKENMMLQIGARIITRSGQAETAETTRINASAENSMLDTLVGNASESIRNCLQDCCLFEGVTEEIEFELNSDFWDETLSAQEVMAMIQGNDAGVMPKAEIVRRLQDGGWIKSTEDPEDILGAMQAESPL